MPLLTAQNLEALTAEIAAHFAPLAEKYKGPRESWPTMPADAGHAHLEIWGSEDCYEAKVEYGFLVSTDLRQDFVFYGGEAEVRVKLADRLADAEAARARGQARDLVVVLTWKGEDSDSVRCAARAAAAAPPIFRETSDLTATAIAMGIAHLDAGPARAPARECLECGGTVGVLPDASECQRCA